MKRVIIPSYNICYNEQNEASFNPPTSTGIFTFSLRKITLKRIFPVRRIQRWIGCVPQTLNPSFNKSLFFLNDVSHPFQSDQFHFFEKYVSHFYLMRLHPHFSPFFFATLTVKTTFILHRKQFIAWHHCMLLIDYLDSLCHIWLVLMTLDTRHHITATHISSSSFSSSAKAFFV